MMDDVRDRRLPNGQAFYQPSRRFEMISNLSVGGSGNAYILVWGHAPPAEGEDPDDDDYIRTRDTFTVYSVDGHFGPTGSKGRAMWANEAQRWEVVSMNMGSSPWLSFRVASAFTADDATVAGCEVLSTWGGRITGSETGDTITVTNELGWSGDETGIGYAQWDDERSIWKINPYQCEFEATS